MYDLDLLSELTMTPTPLPLLALAHPRSHSHRKDHSAPIIHRSMAVSVSHAAVHRRPNKMAATRRLLRGVAVWADRSVTRQRIGRQKSSRPQHRYSNLQPEARKTRAILVATPVRLSREARLQHRGRDRRHQGRSRRHQGNCRRLQGNAHPLLARGQFLPVGKSQAMRLQKLRGNNRRQKTTSGIWFTVNRVMLMRN